MYVCTCVCVCETRKRERANARGIGVGKSARAFLKAGVVRPRTTPAVVLRALQGFRSTPREERAREELAHGVEKRS